MTVSEHVWVGGGGLRGGGVGGSYQPGVYVPLKALFLVSVSSDLRVHARGGGARAQNLGHLENVLFT